MEYLKHHLYALDPPQRTRTVPMQILAVGPSRSGTNSLRVALFQLGYSHCYHGYDASKHPEDDIVWHRLRLKREKSQQQGNNPPHLTAADFDQVIGHSAAIMDHPAAAFAPELIAAYPEAKVILNVRKDIDAWHNSVMKTLIPIQKSWLFWFRSWFSAELFWLHEAFLRGNWNTFYRGSFEQNSRQVLEDHCRMVRSLVPSERLLEWDVNDGWGPLCQFLGKSLPDTPFPVVNKGRVRYEELFRGRIAYADRNIGLCLLVLGVLLALCMMWL